MSAPPLVPMLSATRQRSSSALPLLTSSAPPPNPSERFPVNTTSRATSSPSLGPMVLVHASIFPFVLFSEAWGGALGRDFACAHAAAPTHNRATARRLRI